MLWLKNTVWIVVLATLPGFFITQMSCVVSEKDDTTNVAPEDNEDNDDTEQVDDIEPQPESPNLAQCLPADGSRIEFAKEFTPDNEVRVGSTYDVLRGRCSIRPYPDSSGENKLACVPLSNGGEIYFQNFTCDSGAVAYFTQQNFVKRYIEVNGIVNDNLRTRLYSVGAPLSAAPSTLFKLDRAGNCVQETMPLTGVFLETPGPLSLEQLISFESSTLIAGNIAQTRLTGSDGSVVCDQTNFFDSRLQTECQFIGFANDPIVSCSPINTARIFDGFENSTCETPRLFATNGTFPDVHKFGVYYRNFGECDSAREIYEINSEVSTTFRQLDDGTCVEGQESTWAVGPKLDDNNFVKSSLYIKPESIGRLKRSYLQTTGGLLVDKGTWWDAKLETPCVIPLNAQNATLKRCTPILTGVVNTRFSDEGCTEEIQVVVGDECGGDPIRFGVLTTAAEQRFWELTPRTASTYFYGRSEGSRELGCHLIQEQTYEPTVEISMESFGVVESTLPQVAGE